MKMLGRSKYLLSLSVVCAAFFLSGCITTMKTPSKPGDVWTPPTWEKATKQPDVCWKELRERRSSSVGALGLGEIVEDALANNPSTKQAIEQARAAQARVKEAESAWYPKITVNAQVNSDRRIAQNDINELNNMYGGPEADLTFLLFDFGGRAARAKQALHNLVATNFSYNQTVLDVILSAQKGYYNYYSAMAQLDASMDDLTDSKTTYYAADQRFKAGIVTMLDVLQAKSNYETALFTLEGLRGNLKIAQGDLAKSMGLPADTKLNIQFPTPRTQPDVTKKEVTRVINYALEKRPDIASERATVRAKASALAAANSDLWPTLNLGGTTDANYFDYYGAQKNRVNLDGYQYDLTGYMSVNWNIFDGFNNYSKRNEAKALLKAEEEKLRKAEIEASTDVWDKFYAYKTAVSKLAASEALFVSAKKSYELATDGYKAGLKNILDLLQSQNSLSSARSKVISSRVEVYTSLADLAHSVGLMSTLVEEKSVPVSSQKSPSGN